MFFIGGERVLFGEVNFFVRLNFLRNVDCYVLLLFGWRVCEFEYVFIIVDDFWECYGYVIFDVCSLLVVGLGEVIVIGVVCGLLVYVVCVLGLSVEEYFEEGVEVWIVEVEVVGCGVIVVEVEVVLFGWGGVVVLSGVLGGVVVVVVWVFFGIREYFVGFVDFFEVIFGFGFFVDVWMVFLGEFLVGFLDFCGWSIVCYFEGFVVVLKFYWVFF